MLGLTRRHFLLQRHTRRLYISVPSNASLLATTTSLSNILNRRSFSTRNYGVLQYSLAKKDGHKTRINESLLSGSSLGRLPGRNSLLAVIIVAVVVCPCLFFYLSTDSSNVNRRALFFDPPRFTTFTIIKREIASPTSIILTLRTANVLALSIQDDPYKESWEKGTWSVEIKQPQLQIARSYTPLPPKQGDLPGDLRLFIRNEAGGEMSQYIFSRPLGSQVELRGHYAEFDIPDDTQEVVFLAGGTGIAPALQTAYTLLETRSHDEAHPRQVHILWSNRRREDCAGYKNLITDVKLPLNLTSGLIVQELERLKAQYPSQFTVEYLVDEERTYVDRKRISRYTKQRLQAETQGSRMIMVSGPDGYVTAVAGPKKWEGGKETQGILGGTLSHMNLHDWRVWKL